MAQRANIVRSLKGLEEIIELVEVDVFDPAPQKGWYFSGKFGPGKDPITGSKYLRELYLKTDPEFKGTTIPVLWDKKADYIVNNESSEIIRILYPAFDSLLPAPLRETIKGPTGLLPTHLCNEIGEINEWVYNTINNGIYKCCFATVQAAYDDNIYPLFESFDRLEAHLADPKYSGPYLFGDHITEADMKLYPTLIRFDVAYYMACKANLNMIRYSYPNLHRWLRTLYWDQSGMARPAFSKTTKFERASQAYGAALLHWLYSSSILNGFSSLGISIAHLQEI